MSNLVQSAGCRVLYHLSPESSGLYANQDPPRDFKVNGFLTVVLGVWPPQQGVFYTSILVGTPQKSLIETNSPIWQKGIKTFVQGTVVQGDFSPKKGLSN